MDYIKTDNQTKLSTAFIHLIQTVWLTLTTKKIIIIIILNYLIYLITIPFAPTSAVKAGNDCFMFKLKF